MAWWSSDDRRFDSWKCGQSKVESKSVGAPDEEEECCYSSCLSCDAPLFAVILFKSCVPIEVLTIGPENDWPNGYFR